MSAPGEARVHTICLALLSAVAGAFALHWLAPVLIPFVLALFVSLGLSMCVEWLVRRARIPRRLALPCVLVLGLAFLAGLGGIFAAAVAQLAENAPAYAEQLGQLIDGAARLLPRGALPFGGDAAAEGGGLLREIPVATVGGLLARTTNAVLNLLSQSLLVLIFVLFLLLGGSGSANNAAARAGVFGEIRRSVERYLFSKFVISALTGLLVGAVLGALGIPLAMAFGALAFLLNFIPNVGSLIATLLPLPVILAAPEIGFAAGLAALLIPAAIQALVGNYLEPKWMGDALDLHPIAILLSLIFWGMLWGVPGMLMATPITAVGKIFLQKFSATRPLAEALAGRITFSTGGAQT